MASVSCRATLLCIICFPKLARADDCHGTTALQTEFDDNLAAHGAHTIVWDANSGGYVSDRGYDINDAGNYIRGSFCSSALEYYSDGVVEVSSDCFSTGGSYEMSIGTYSMMLFTSNPSTTETTDTYIMGNLGAGNYGSVYAYTLTSGCVRGYVKMVCATRDPGFHYLFVVKSCASGESHTMSLHRTRTSTPSSTFSRARSSFTQYTRPHRGCATARAYTRLYSVWS